jgi:ribonuclease Z
LSLLGKLHAYTWNICQNLRLIVAVHEVHPEKILLTELESWRAFRVNPPSERPHSDVLLENDDFSVKYIELDHKTPSFAYSFIEADSCNVQKETMQAMGLEPGPWVAELKKSAFRKKGADELLDIAGTPYRLDELKEKLLIRKQGCKISYLTDFLFDSERLDDIRRFPWESDFFFCEAAFSEAERDKARATHHLTAKDAGKLANLAQVRQLILFHFSKRYQDYSVLLNEAKSEFPAVE